MNIVVVVPGGLTEMLQAAPLVAALSGGVDAPMLVAGAPAAAEVVSGLAGVDLFLPIAGLRARPGPAGLGRLWWNLRGRRLDAALVCSELASVRAAVYAAAIPRRVGRAGGLSDHLLTDRVPAGEQGNRAQSWLRLADALGIEPAAPRWGYTLPPDAVTSAEQLLLSNGVGDGRLLVAIAPGSGFADHAVAAWNPERYAHLANRLAPRHGAGIGLVGDERDRAAADAMRLDLAADTVDLCGEVDLSTTGAVIARCDLLVGADTPLLHLAASVGTASVGLFGATSGGRGAPAGSDHRVVQALPNGHSPAGLESIRVDDVLAGIESAL